MCKDIKLLDTAKHNLTTSISTLRKFSDFMAARDDLSQLCSERNYEQAYNRLLAIIDLSQFFKPHQNIPQVQESLKEKDNIISRIRLQITDDFSLLFRGLSDHSLETFQHACKLAEVIGRDFVQELIKMPVDLIIEPYKQLYEKR